MTTRRKMLLSRVLPGGVLGGGGLLHLCSLINLLGGPGMADAPWRVYAPWCPAMAASFRTPAHGLVLLCALAFAFGATLGAAPLARRAALHFAVSAALLLALGRVAFWYTGFAGAAGLLGLYAALCAAAWLIRRARQRAAERS